MFFTIYFCKRRYKIWKCLILVLENRKDKVYEFCKKELILFFLIFRKLEKCF